MSVIKNYSGVLRIPCVVVGYSMVPRLAGMSGGPVTPVPVAVALKGGVIGAAYSEIIGAQGGCGGYLYTITDGTLPTSLILNSSTGLINGTPSATGMFTFTIKVADSIGNFGEQEFSITVAVVRGSSIKIQHSFFSEQPQGSEPSKVSKNEWNADHVGTMLGTVGITIDGGGSVPATGMKGIVQIPYDATISGWTIIADQSGSASIDVWFIAGSAPPDAPPIPTNSDKISASAPIVLSSERSAAGDAAAIETWAKDLTQWGAVGFYLSSVETCQSLTITLQLERSI